MVETRTGGRVGVVTELEQATLDIAAPIQSTMFSRVLRNARRANPDATLPHPTEQILELELSFDPAIQRAFAGAQAYQVMHGAEPPSSDWLKWNQGAHRAMARIAAKCWAGVDDQIRAVLVDIDNFQPIHNMLSLHNLRADAPGPALRFYGLDGQDVRAGLARIWEAARQTPTHVEARSACRQIREDRSLLLRWAQLSQKGIEALQRLSSTATIGEAASLGLEVVRTTYADGPLQPFARVLRRHNRLVQEICFAILGLAEDSPIMVTDPIGAIRCTVHDDGVPCVRLTVDDDAVAATRLSHPVRLSTGSPIDGLYHVIGYSVSWQSSAGSIDLSLVPLKWAEGRWPPRQLET